jgi:hypothetical protein
MDIEREVDRRDPKTVNLWIGAVVATLSLVSVRPDISNSFSESNSIEIRRVASTRLWI